MNAGAVAYPIIAKCLDTEAFFEGILWNKGRGFLFYLFVCLFCRPHTDLIPKVMQRLLVSSIKKVKAGCSVFMLVCVCISSFLESVFFFLSAFKKAALSFSVKLHLFERTEAGRCLQSQIRRQKIFHPHTAPTPPSAPAAMQAGGL